MKHLILGTAGHIDHGKTSLVKALTGIDTDRLKEEKKRGITIELGFAHLALADGIDFGIVDVPGHEKFVRAMVAGVAGMDMVMLVIAADEGIMPQTREHLDILRLLGIHSGLVALTKSDLVEDDWRSLVIEEVRDFVAGTFLEAAPIIPVSSKTGKGIEEIKKELAQLAYTTAEKKYEGSFRLPIDRVFTISGFGTVVTGTLLSGEIKIGDELELLPSRVQGRVRGIQAYGNKADSGLAGQRLAVNIQGVELNQADRGDVLVPANHFRISRRIDVRLNYLASASRNLKHRSKVRFHSGTSEITAQVILLEQDIVSPGQSAYAQLRLEQPLLLVSGDPYLIRATSPSVTIGGGVVLDPFPPARRRRNEEALNLLESLDAAEHQKTCYLIIRQSLLSGISFEDISLRSGITHRQAEAALQSLLSAGLIVQMTREPRIFLSKESVGNLKELLQEALTAYLAANPLKEGISKEELKTRLPTRSNQRFFAPLLTELQAEGKLLIKCDLVTSPVEKKITKPGIANQTEKIINILSKHTNEPPTIKELAEMTDISEKEIRAHLAVALRNGLIIKISSDIHYKTETVKEIEAKLIVHLKAKGEITPAEFRELTGLSRKYMIPLLEYFDSKKLTIRIGDKRIMRGKQLLGS